jgi:hypothetical protein
MAFFTLPWEKFANHPACVPIRIANSGLNAVIIAIFNEYSRATEFLSQRKYFWRECSRKKKGTADKL